MHDQAVGYNFFKAAGHQCLESARCWQVTSDKLSPLRPVLLSKFILTQVKFMLSWVAVQKNQLKLSYCSMANNLLMIKARTLCKVALWYEPYSLWIGSVATMGNGILQSLQPNLVWKFYCHFWWLGREIKSLILRIVDYYIDRQSRACP